MTRGCIKIDGIKKKNFYFFSNNFEEIWKRKRQKFERRSQRKKITPLFVAFH